MKIKINSWHTQLYFLFYGGFESYIKGYDENDNRIYEHKLPRSICPYFWKLVLAVLLFAPFTIIILPWLIVEMIQEKDVVQKQKKGGFFDEGRIILGLGIWFFISILVSMVLYPFNNANKLMESLAICGYLMTIITVFFLLIVGTSNLIKRITRKKTESKPSVLSTYIQARKDKVCPPIQWEE